MKKEKQHSEKKKEFAHSPFRSLKEIKGSFAEEKKVPVKRETLPPPKAVDEDDAAIFLRSVGDVKPLHKRDEIEHKPERPLPVRVEVDLEEKKLFMESMKSLDVKFVDELPPDVVPLRQGGTSRMRQLRRGAIRIDLELDLHGLTRDEALQNLERFITGAYSRGQKAVLVITGRGNNSPGEPVLQGAVSAWLREKGKAMVVEFAPAPRNLGGSGAFIVFLRQKTVAE